MDTTQATENNSTSEPMSTTTKVIIAVTATAGAMVLTNAVVTKVQAIKRARALKQSQETENEN